MTAEIPNALPVNTRVLRTRLGRVIGRPATLDDVPDATLDGSRGRLRLGVAPGVWQTGEASRAVSRADAGLRREFETELPDLREEDIAGSGFAITGYEVHASLGGDAALARIRARLAERGLRLMLDFVPNHTALDHPWVRSHQDFYVHGSEGDLLREPANWTWVSAGSGRVLLAHGRDPYFPGWTDTLQLDYSNPATCAAMTEELVRIAARCDGVRCDMAMLILPEIFERTWGRPALPFWPATIAAARDRNTGFRLIAEVYWDLEWRMLQEGFDDAYDKRLYDRLVAGPAGPVRHHLAAPVEDQARLVRFLENHDEPRAAAAIPPGRHEAAAIIAYLTPGFRLFHQGQLEGRRVHLSPHLVRTPDEPVDLNLQRFYRELLAILRDPAFRDGTWRILSGTPAWDGNPSHESFVAFAWAAPDLRWLVVVNFEPDRGQARVGLSSMSCAGGGRARSGHGTVYARDGDGWSTLVSTSTPGWSAICSSSIGAGGGGRGVGRSGRIRGRRSGLIAGHAGTEPRRETGCRTVATAQDSGNRTHPTLDVAPRRI
jgi:hypothetical protein